MKLVTFFRKLKEVAAVKPFKMMLPMTADAPGGFIRQKRTGRCPICALCFALTGKKYEDHNFDMAANEIGLHCEDAAKVARAADGYFGYDGNAVRKKLMKALGLKEAA